MATTLERILHRVTLLEMGPATPCVVGRDTTLGEVHAQLADDECRAVVVCDDDGRPVGIFTDRDVLYRTALEALDPETPIVELMTPEPQTLSPGDHVADAVAAMTRGGLRHIPLVDDHGRVAGIVSSRAVLRYLARFYSQAVLNLPPRLDQRLERPEGG